MGHHLTFCSTHLRLIALVALAYSDGCDEAVEPAYREAPKPAVASTVPASTD